MEPTLILQSTPCSRANMTSTKSSHCPLPLHRKNLLLRLMRVQQKRALPPKLPSVSRVDALLFRGARTLDGILLSILRSMGERPPTLYKEAATMSSSRRDGIR